MPTIDELASQVAALEQQMAAIITPPDKYYTSIYSGEEIDAAITKVRAGAIGVSSFNGRTGAVLPQAGDYNATQIPVSADAGAETVAAALNNKPNRNLLDNWYFVGGGSQQGEGQFPINQRGQTSYNTPGYSIDRWYLSTGSFSLDESGINPNTETSFLFQQVIDSNSWAAIRGKTVTVSALVGNELKYQVIQIPTSGLIDTGLGFLNGLELDIYSGDALHNGSVRFLTGTFFYEAPIKAVKLELGSQQTLAHQDEDGNWVLNEIPDYGAELAKCQRYAYVLDGSPYNTQFVFDQANNRLIGNIPFPATMRTAPSVSMFPLTLRNTTNGASVIVSSAQLFVTNAGLSLLYQMQVSEGGPLVDGNIYSPNSKIIFSADL